MFLKRNQKKFGEIGKKAIITEMLMCEAESKFREEMERYNEKYLIEKAGENVSIVKGKDNSRALQDWYSHLFYRMTEELIEKNDYQKFSDTGTNNVSFITFNYDRSLEHFLYDSLKHTFFEIYEEHKDKIREQLLELNERIIHVYGKVAKLEWEKTEKDEISVPYQKGEIKSYNKRPCIDIEIDVNTLSNNIKLPHERKDTELDDAKKLISEADRIFFLGFGYAKENLDILGLPTTLKDGVEIYGTAFGATENEIRDFEKKFPPTKEKVCKEYCMESELLKGTTEPEEVFEKRWPSIRSQSDEYKVVPFVLKIENMDCLVLLREYL